MQFPMRFVMPLLAATLAEPVQAVTPIQKVVEMLQGMLAKGQQEKHAEEVQFATYKQFCTDTEAEKTRMITEASESIELLKADILKYSTESSDLQTKVAELQGDLATYEADTKAAQTTRQIEKENYEKIHKTYTESIDAIRQAVEVIKAQSTRTIAQAPLTTLLLQGKLPKAARGAIEAFLARSDDSYDPPDAHGYEFQSSGVLDMLEKLKEKFVDERTALEKEELKKHHAYELIVADLKDSIKISQTAVTEKTQLVAKDDQVVAEKKGSLEETEATKAADEQYLAKTQSTCSQKSADFTERQKLRADEIAAIQQAITILSDEVAGRGTKYLPTDLLQRPGTRPMLLQLQRSDAAPSNQLRVAAYLHDEATRLRSPVLSALSIRVRDDPFAKVKKMIRDLISRLEQQAGEEAQHKTWCETELTTNGEARRAKTSQVETLKSQIDETNAQIAKIALEISELDSDIAELKANAAKDIQFREDDKKKNEETIDDAKEAQKAVARAIVILKEFYARAADSTALLQAHKQQPIAPAIFDSPYKGQGPDGVISMLEVIQSDFARLESETTAAESVALQAFNEKRTTTSVDQSTKETSLEHIKRQKSNLETSLTDKEADLTTTEKELNAADQYYEKLKPSCLETGVSYQEREERRQEEIQSLQEALRILNGEDLATLLQESA